MSVLQKRTYSLPAATLADFEQAVAAGARSATVARLLREWLDEVRRRELREEVVVGCREMASDYLAIEREYHPLEEEVERAAESKPPARRSGSRAP